MHLNFLPVKWGLCWFAGTALAKNHKLDSSEKPQCVLSVPASRNPKSRKRLHQELEGKAPFFLPFLASGGCVVPTPVSVAPLPPFSSVCPSPCPSLLEGHLSLDLGPIRIAQDDLPLLAHFLTSAKALFPSKVTFPGSRDEDTGIRFGGHPQPTTGLTLATSQIMSGEKS